MEYMKTISDKFFDLAIVDPPYGIGAPKMEMGSGYSGGSYNAKNRLNTGSGKLKNRILNKSDCSWDNSTPDAEYFKELFRISKNQIIWGGITLTFRRPVVLSAGISASPGRTFHRSSLPGPALISRQNFLNK